MLSAARTASFLSLTFCPFRLARNASYATQTFFEISTKIIFLRENFKLVSWKSVFVSGIKLEIFWWFHLLIGGKRAGAMSSINKTRKLCRLRLFLLFAFRQHFVSLIRNLKSASPGELSTRISWNIFNLRKFCAVFNAIWWFIYVALFTAIDWRRKGWKCALPKRRFIFSHRLTISFSKMATIKKRKFLIHVLERFLGSSYVVCIILIKIFRELTCNKLASCRSKAAQKEIEKHEKSEEKIITKVSNHARYYSVVFPNNWHKYY